MATGTACEMTCATKAFPKQAGVAEQHAGDIDLLVTDVVMPEMNGRDLAEHLLSRHPGMKRLFMSGYTADVVADHGVLDEEVHFIQKPFSRQDLAAKVREALDAEPRAEGATIPAPPHGSGWA